jgi:hypothetical protein
VCDDETRLHQAGATTEVIEQRCSLVPHEEDPFCLQASATTVYQVNGAPGAIATMTLAPGSTIGGAGVSTSAPVIIQ